VQYTEISKSFFILPLLQDCMAQPTAFHIVHRGNSGCYNKRCTCIHSSVLFPDSLK